MKKSCLIVFCYFIFGFSIVTFSQILPSDRFKFIENIGLETQRPIYYDKVVDVCKPPYNLTPDPNGDFQSNSSKLNQIIQDLRSVSGWKCIYFSQVGTYRFGNQILLTIADTNLVFKGINSGQVILHFKIGNHASHIFDIKGYPGQATAINETLYKGMNSIISGFPIGINNGDWVEIYNEWSTNMNLGSWAKIGQITKIKSSEEKTLRDEFTITYLNTYANKIRKIQPIYNIGFEDFTIRRDGDDGYSTDGASSNFNFEYAVNCWIFGVESWGTRGWHVGIGKSSNIYIHGNFFHHSNSYAGGCGYGVSVFSRSSNCLIENNIFNYLRHSILVQASANRNVFSYNYSYDRESIYHADISIHGTYPNTNLFEENFVEYIHADYTTGSDGKYENGPYNTFFRNKVERNGDYGNIIINAAEYTNILGNQCGYLNYDSRSNFMFDAYGYTTPEPVLGYSHNFVNHNRYIENTLFIKDYSYFYAQRPTWLPSNFTWPTIGPRVNSGASFSTNTIPAKVRKEIGGKFTLDGPIIRTIVKLNSGYYSETGTIGGSYKINGSSSNVCYPEYGEQVIIEAIPQNAGDSFYRWSDGNGQNPRIITAKSRIELHAEFKKVRTSNSETAYESSSQRKFFKSYQNILFSVYESLGKVWIEYSTNNGQNWYVGNEGKPLFLGYLAKNPSIEVWSDVDFSWVFVAAQVSIGYDHNSIWVSRLKWDLAGFKELNREFVNSDIDLFNYVTYDNSDFKPVIGMLNSGEYFVVSVPSSVSNSNLLNFFVGRIGLNNVISWPVYDFFYNLNNYEILNPALHSTKKDIDPSQSEVYSCWLAYQEKIGNNSQIRVVKIYLQWHYYGTELTIEDHGNISALNGFSNNYNPTITAFKDGDNEKVLICWIGYRKGIGLEGLENGGQELPAGEKKVFFKQYYNGAWSPFSSYGNNVGNVSINSNTNTNNTFAFAWNEGSSNINKFVRSDALNNVHNTNTTGKNIQVGNFSNLNNMRLNSFTTSNQPYTFILSNPFSIMPVSDEIEREGIVVKDTTAFYFSIGGITVDNLSKDFIVVPDTTLLNNQEELNSYLISEPFYLTENSNFTYGIKFGVTDSTSASTELNNGKYIHYKVELIEDQTNNVLSVLDEVIFNSENLIPYESNAYSVNLQGIGSKVCRLRLKINNNLNFSYSLIKSYNNEEILAKRKFISKSLNGLNPVTTYALEQNYPNPFNPTTILRYQIPKDGLVVLKVYDILGRDVSTLVNELKTAGRYEVNFDASNLSSGVYLYRLNVDEYNSTMKMILIK